ncbi:MAG: beta-propeller domain-containing protein, partial [Myxococcales bacterium]|nr:beta-propeller domain-containing protein [Myxococcales bacterium]
RVGLAATALAGSFVAGMVVAQTGGGQVTDPVRLTHAALRPASSCEELRQWFVDRAMDQVTAWGWGDPYPVYYADDLSFGVGEAGGPVPVAGARTEEVGSSETGTNVQEAGVDEPDTVKTSGGLMVTVDGNVLSTYDVSGDAPVKLGQVVLPGVDSAEILLSGDTVVAVGPERGAATRRALPGRPFPGLLQETRLTVVDVGHPSDPTVSDTRVFD